MTTYEIDPEPESGQVWFIDGGERVWRDEDGGWRMPGGEVYDWPNVLRTGRVTDVHPDLPADAPLPWVWVEGDGIHDASGDDVYLSENYGPFIVKAANAYGERLAAEEQTTGGLIARKFLVERDAARAELAEVLSDLRTFFCEGCSASIDSAERRLRARL